MSAIHPSHRDRLHDLLATRATEPLSIADDRELAALLREFPKENPLSFDEAAAAVDLALLRESDVQPMPAAVRARVKASAVAFAAGSRGLKLVNDDGMPAAPAPVAPAPRRNGFWAALPWVVAACLGAAVLAWVPRLWEPRPSAVYAQLAADPCSLRATWDDAGDVGATGDIVWDQERQRGVMRFRGLAANDPQRLQYQLWIFDAGRESSAENGVIYNAVDGGVFNVERAGGDVFVEVDAKLPVFEPSLFAVTTEPPGGVVKHVTRGEYRIILTAPAGTGS